MDIEVHDLRPAIYTAVTAYPLYLLYAKSLETSVLPAYWKLAEVTAIIRKVNELIEVTIDQLV